MADLRGAGSTGRIGPSGLTRGFAELGRLSVSRLVRLDLRRLAARIAALAEEHGESPGMVRASGLVRWAGLLVRNFELTLYWGIAWAVAHVALVIVASFAWRPGGPPAHVALAVDLPLGLMFGISLLRLAVTTTRVRRLSAFRRPDPAQPRLVNPPRAPLLPRLLEPGDLDLVLVAAVLVIAELIA